MSWLQKIKQYNPFNTAAEDLVQPEPAPEKPSEPQGLQEADNTLFSSNTITTTANDSYFGPSPLLAPRTSPSFMSSIVLHGGGGGGGSGNFSAPVPFGFGATPIENVFKLVQQRMQLAGVDPIYQFQATKTTTAAQGTTVEYKVNLEFTTDDLTRLLVLLSYAEERMNPLRQSVDMHEVLADLAERYKPAAPAAPAPKVTPVSPEQSKAFLDSIKDI